MHVLTILHFPRHLNKHAGVWTCAQICFLHSALHIHHIHVQLKPHVQMCLHRTMTDSQPSLLLQLLLSPPSSAPLLLVWPPKWFFLEYCHSVSWVGKPADTHTHRKKNKIRQNNSSAHTDANIRTHILSQVAGQSCIVRFASIPDGKAVLSVYLAPGHPWDSLSGFSLLPKTCSPVYLLIDSQRKAKIDSVAPTSLKSFLAKQALHAITC